MKTMARFVGLCNGAAGLFILLMLVAGCGGEKKMAPVAVGDMEDYRDPGIGFRIKYPKGWLANTEVGQARFFSGVEVDKRFLDPTGPYPSGVRITVTAKKATDPAAALKQEKDDLAQMGTAGQEQSLTVAGFQGTKVPLTANYGSNSILYGHHVVLRVDSMIYHLGFEGFGQQYEAHAAIFEASMNSFQPPKPVEKGRDVTLPSENYSEGDTKYFKYQYPENFNFNTPPKASFEYSLELRGYRQDCSIRFDVFDAKKLTVEKVFEQNRGKYKSKSTGKGTIGGTNALYLNYTPAAQVESRAYFAVRNDKVFRVTLNWYKPQEKEYMAAFEKIIGSIKFK